MNIDLGIFKFRQELRETLRLLPRIPDGIDALLWHVVSEDALDAAVVAVVAPARRPRVVVQLCELHIARVAALGADEKLPPALPAGLVAVAAMVAVLLVLPLGGRRRLRFLLALSSCPHRGQLSGVTTSGF